MGRKALFVLCVFGLPLAHAAIQFDAPLEKKQLNLQPVKRPALGESYTPSEETDYRRISCFYFDRFMVKEINLCVDAGCSGKDEGAYRLSILPFTNPLSKPQCQWEPTSGEYLVPTAGHFMGAKGDQFFFSESSDSGDGVDVYSGKTGEKSGRYLKREVQ